MTAAKFAWHDRPPQLVDLPVTLVIVESSQNWLDAPVGSKWFQNLRVLVTPDDHMSLVRRPDCLEWQTKLP